MSTVNEIVAEALRKSGNRDTTNTTLLADGLTALNRLLTSWDKSLIPYTTNENWTLTVGTNYYSIGSGGTWDTVRPIQIVSAYIRDSDGYDYEVKQFTREEYDQVSDKDFSGRPSRLYYNASNPLGYIYFDSDPSSAEVFYLTSYKPITAYTALTDTILQPVEYEKAIIYNLAIDLAEENNTVPIASVYKQAEILLNRIMIRNSQPTKLAKLDLGLYRHVYRKNSIDTIY